MRAGNLRTPFKLQTKAISQGNAGEPVETWTDFVESRGLIVPSGGREAEINEQEMNVSRIKLRIRWGPNIDSSMRAVLEVGGRSEIWEIESVSNADRRGRTLTLDLIRYEDGGFRYGE